MAIPDFIGNLRNCPVRSLIRTNLALLTIVLMASIPIFWAPWDVILISEDLALPQTTQQFFLNLHSWNPILNTGTPYNVAHTAIPLFAQQAGLQGLGLSPAATQRIIMMIWMLFPGISIYVLIQTLFGSHIPNYRWKAAGTVAASFYMFNLYVEHAWRGFNIAVLSAQTALPLILTLLYLGFTGRISTVRLALLTIPVAIWASGVGVNPPLVLVFLTTIIIFIVSYLLFSRNQSLSARIVPISRTVSIVGVVSLLTNAFWIVPFLGQVQATTSGELTTSSELASTWLGGLSANTSLPKVLRFQGDWTWYQGWNEPYRAYAQIYEESAILIVFSWMTPILTILGLKGSKQRLRIFFAIITTIALLLSMGIHTPMNNVYLWLVKNIPLFWIIRSPWFKFGLITTLGFAVLSGLGAMNLASWLQSFRHRSPPGLWAHRQSIALVAIIVVTINLVYAFPVTTGQMFPSPETRKHLPSNQMRVPGYISDASTWFAQNVQDGRVAALPETTVWVDENGFVGSAPVLTQIGTTPIIYPFNTVHGSLVSATNARLNDIAYEAIYRTTTRRADEILKLMNVQYLNHETGIKHWLYAGDSDSPEWVQSRLDRQLGIQLAKTIGDWQIYSVNGALPRLYLASHFSIVVGGVESLPSIVGMDLLAQPALVFSEQQTPETLSRALGSPLLRDIIFFSSSYEELTLDLIPTKYRYPVPRSGIPVTISVDKTSKYRVWLRSPDRQLFPSGDLAIDGKPLDLSLTPPEETPFWIPLGSHVLSRGSHLLTGTLNSAPGEVVILPEDALPGLAAMVNSKIANPEVRVAIMASSEVSPITATAVEDETTAKPVSFRFGEDLANIHFDPDGTPWRWLEPGGRRALIANNASATPVRTNIMITVDSVEIPRDFYVFELDGSVPLTIQKLAGNRATDILIKDVLIPPGESYLSFYSANAGTAIGDKIRNFRIKDGTLRSGRLAFNLVFNTMRSGIHQIEIRPFDLDALPNTVTAYLDGKLLELELQHQLGEPTYVTSLALESGTHTVTLHQDSSENYVIRILNGSNSARNPIAESIPLLSTNPTSHSLEVASDSPSILIFGESFDPRWEASSNTKVFEQFRVNGFANGYLLPPGHRKIHLSFGPQKLFIQGAAISTVAIGFILLGGIVFLLQKRMNR